MAGVALVSLVGVEIARLALQYLTVLVWPAVVVTLLLAYRVRVAALLPTLSGLTAGSFSATFDASVAQATALHDENETTSRPSVDELEVLAPTSYTEARQLGDHARADKPVLLDLQHLPDEQAKRLVDFAAGLVFVSHGSIRKVRPRTYVVTPGRPDRDHDGTVDQSSTPPAEHS